MIKKKRCDSWIPLVMLIIFGFALIVIGWADGLCAVKGEVPTIKSVGDSIMPVQSADTMLGGIRRLIPDDSLLIPAQVIIGTLKTINYSFPIPDGSAGQVFKTDGSGSGYFGNDNTAGATADTALYLSEVAGGSDIAKWDNDTFLVFDSDNDTLKFYHDGNVFVLDGGGGLVTFDSAAFLSIAKWISGSDTTYLNKTRLDSIIAMTGRYNVVISDSAFQLSDFDNSTIDTNNAGALKIVTDGVDDTYIDFGTGANQVSASDMPNEDLGDISVSSGLYTLDPDIVAPAEMADADHGAFTYSGGVATIDSAYLAAVKFGDTLAHHLKVDTAGDGTNVVSMSSMVIQEGSDVVITVVNGDTVDLALSPTASAGFIVKEDNTVIDSTVTVLDFGSGFVVTETPEDEVNVTLDYSEDPVTLSGSDVTGVLPKANGGAGVSLAGYDGILGFNNAGGTTVDVSTKAELETEISDVSDFMEGDGDTVAGTYDYSDGVISDVDSLEDVDLADIDTIIVGSDKVWDLTGTGLTLISGALTVTGGTADSTGKYDTAYAPLAIKIANTIDTTTTLDSNNIVAGGVNLTTDVSEILPDANVADNITASNYLPLAGGTVDSIKVDTLIVDDKASFSCNLNMNAYDVFGIDSLNADAVYTDTVGISGDKIADFNGNGLSVASNILNADTTVLSTKGHAEAYADSINKVDSATYADTAGFVSGKIDSAIYADTADYLLGGIELEDDADVKGDLNIYGQFRRNNYKEMACTTEVFCDNASEHWDYLCNYGVSNGGPSDSGLLTDTSYFGVHPSALYFAKGYGCNQDDSIYAYDTSASPDTLVTAWAIKDEKRRYIMAWTPLPVMPYERMTFKWSNTGKYNDWERICVECTTTTADTFMLCIKDPPILNTDLDYYVFVDMALVDTLHHFQFGRDVASASADPDIFIDKDNEFYCLFTANVTYDSVYTIDMGNTTGVAVNTPADYYIAAIHSPNLFNWDTDSIYYSFKSPHVPYCPMLEQGGGDTLIMWYMIDPAGTSNYVIRLTSTTLEGDSVWTITDTCVINNYMSADGYGAWHGDILKIGSEFHFIFNTNITERPLHYAISYDQGIIWDMKGDPILEVSNTPAAFDSGGNLYRPTFIAENSGDGLRFRMWYSALKQGSGGACYHMGQAYVTFDYHERVKQKELVIWDPDAIDDTIPIFYIDSAEYPQGIKILSMECQTDADGTYALNVLSFTAADPPVFEDHIDTLNIGASDQRVQSEIFEDDEVEAGKIMYLNTPATDKNWLRFSFRYYRKVICD